MLAVSAPTRAVPATVVPAKAPINADAQASPLENSLFGSSSASNTCWYKLVPPSSSNSLIPSIAITWNMSENSSPNLPRPNIRSNTSLPKTASLTPAAAVNTIPALSAYSWATVSAMSAACASNSASVSEGFLFFNSISFLAYTISYA